MEPVAYLIEGFDGSGKLYAKIVQFTVDEARNSAAEFARRYSTVTTTPLIRATHGVGVPPVGPAPSAQGPTELWLQLHGDCSEADLSEPVDYTGGDVTWCWHKINDSDVRYVRADIAGVEACQFPERCERICNDTPVAECLLMGDLEYLSWLHELRTAGVDLPDGAQR